MHLILKAPPIVQLVDMALEQLAFHLQTNGTGDAK